MRFGSLLCLLSPFILAGCEGSLARNVAHPDRQFFDHGDYRIVVLKQANGWSSWYDGKSAFYLVPNLEKLKPIQINAIEQASGCRVTDSYRVLNNQPAYLVASVNCTSVPTVQ